MTQKGIKKVLTSVSGSSPMAPTSLAALTQITDSYASLLQQFVLPGTSMQQHMNNLPEGWAWPGHHIPQPQCHHLLSGN